MKKILPRLSSAGTRAALLWTLFFYIPVAGLAAYSIVRVQELSKTLDGQLASDRRTIAVTGRITAFGEQIVKSILLVEKAVRENRSTQEPIYQLQISADRADQIVNAFNEGSETVAPDGVRFMLEAVEDPAALEILNEINITWFGIKTRADQIVLTAGPKKENTEALPFTLNMLSESSLFVDAQEQILAEKVLALGRRIEELQQVRVRTLEQPRSALIGVAALCIIALPGVFAFNRVRRARNRSAKLAADLGESQARLEAQARALATAKDETDRIMETVQEGLMLVDEQGVIGEHHSRELNAILRQEHLAGRNLLHILERLLSEKMFNTTRDYLALLFNAKRKEKTVLQVNPLTDIEVNFPNPAGGFIHRYLGFSFRRIVEDGRVVRVFVAVRDITHQVELEKKLRESEQHKERQLDILLSIVHVDPAELDDFITLAERELDTVNDTLRVEHFANTGGQGKELRERLQAVYRSVHNLKGNASLLKLGTFQKAAHQLETKLQELLDRPVLGGDDFLAIVVAQAGLRADLGDMIELRGKLTGLRRPAAGNASTEPSSADPVSAGSRIGDGLRQLVETASRELDRATVVDIDDYALHTVARGRETLARDVLIQLTRNSLAHSVEPVAARQALGKPASATLSVRGLPRTADGMVGLAFRDDGRGLDIEAIRRRAVEAGLVSPNARPEPADIARHIFSPGFSTAAQVGDHAGRGVGMDIIKTKVVDEAGGAIEVHCTPGEYCEFHLYFPQA